MNIPAAIQRWLIRGQTVIHVVQWPGFDVVGERTEFFYLISDTCA